MAALAGFMTPLIEAGSYSPAVVACVTIAIACGGTVLSHFNDSGFWLLKEYFGMTEKQTLASWTVMETIIGVTGVTVVLLRSEEHTSELQSRGHLVCRLLLEKN